MRCIICDRCKKIVEDEQKTRVITCARPLTRPKPGTVPVTYRGDDRQMNDIMWMKEVCMNCAAELDTFMEPFKSEPAPPSDPSTSSE